MNLTKSSQVFTQFHLTLRQELVLDCHIMSSSRLILPAALGLSLVTVTAFVVYYIFKKEEDGAEGNKNIKSARMNIIEVKVSKSIVPALIGAGGANVNEICHRSGARVKVTGLSTDKSSERIINIRGTDKQIQEARKLIENYVAQEVCRREIEQAKSPRHVARSPSPSELGERSEPPQHTGERPHAKYKRPESATASIEVYVSAVSSPSRFWVQFVGPQVAQLDELVAHMTEYYANKENRAAHAVADLFFLDYGDSEYVATRELCELRADLLRLRFQAMECFLAGVRPPDSGDGENRWDQWSAPAVERFEELAQVARWKPLVSRTCTYKKTASAEGAKEKEIPGIKLYEVTDEGELDIGAVLIEEGLAAEGEETEVMAASESSASGVQATDSADVALSAKSAPARQPHLNGSSDFLDTERLNMDTQNASSETLTPKCDALTKIQREECKANMNRIDSHRNLESLAQSTHELHYSS
ncbi:Tudor domain protein [Operophtera brumata]|uniref:Tudor domain protein n=1 Tax=Operophtera brumata TaxID=104452 RepID=A0A0L7LE94_OPEBR|nr:Tudor domain protein [Operophtera brumata]